MDSIHAYCGCINYDKLSINEDQYYIENYLIINTNSPQRFICKVCKTVWKTVFDLNQKSAAKLIKD